MTNNSPSGIISQDIFNEYAATWLSVVANDAELNQSFQVSGSKLLSVSFTMEQIQQLVSVVGAHYIMAKFLVTASGSQFSLALYAADAERQRLSSYYIAGDTTVVPSLPGEEVPDVLANQWLENWSNASPVTREMFASSLEGAPLQGYTFDINDFLALFYDVTDIKGQTLLVHFGLHEYYRTVSGEDKLTQTFGLVLRVKDGDTSTDPFYDMSAPCPPLC